MVDIKPEHKSATARLDGRVHIVKILSMSDKQVMIRISPNCVQWVNKSKIIMSW